MPPVFGRKLGAAAPLKFREDVVEAAALAVAAIGAHGVQCVGCGDDPHHAGQVFAHQPGGVAGAVVPLVVVAGP